LIAPAVYGVIKTRAILQSSNGSQSSQAGPVIRTDKESYLAGEKVTISGSGFSPLEHLMLRVSHVDGTVEAGMGHDSWFVDAGANGTFQAVWSIDMHDTAGVSLMVEAAGSSGLKANATFVRKGAITSDRSSYGRLLLSLGSRLRRCGLYCLSGRRLPADQERNHQGR